MSRLAAALITGLLASLFLAAPALAHRAPPDPWLARAWVAATRYWAPDYSPCSRITIGHFTGWMQGSRPGCRIWVSWTAWFQRRSRYPVFCRGITHELGHNLGFGHSPFRWSVMYRIVNWAVQPYC